jgi:glutathione S-transferase
MLTVYDNPFSPFARKVRMVLRFKGLEFESRAVIPRSV